MFTEVLSCLIDLKRAEALKDSIVVPDEENVADYYEIRTQLDELQKDVRDVITHPNYAVPFLNAGRLVYIKHGTLDFGWGIVLNHQKKQPLNKVGGVLASITISLIYPFPLEQGLPSAGRFR